MLHAAPRSGGVVKSERPLWVISERRVTFAQCPLYPHLLSFGFPLSAISGRRLGTDQSKLGCRLLCRVKCFVGMFLQSFSHKVDVGA
jgi:hypothetical protein